MLIMLMAVEIGFGSPEAFSESLEPMKNVTVKEVYFAGEEAEFLANFMPSEAVLIDPAGQKIPLNFEKSDGLYSAKYRFEKGVLLGEYRIVADEVEKRFFVDFCELKITHEGGFFNLTAKTIFSEPKFDFSIDSEIGEGVGNVSIPLNAGKHTYRASCGNSILEGEFEVRFNIGLRGGEIFATLDGERVNAKLKVYADKNFEFYDFFRAKDVNSTEFTVEAEYKHLKAKRNFSLSLDRELYFPNQTVLIRTNLAEAVRIFDPANREFLIEVKDGIASFSLEKDVLLGEYRVEVDGFEKIFFVDFYSINAGIADGILRGSVKWHFVRPDSVIYRTELEKGAVNLSENGEFSIALKEGWEFLELECGNAHLRLIEKSVEVERLYFVGDKVVIRANFKPEESFILFGEEKIQIEFSEKNGSWFYEFVAEKIGSYRLVIDGVEREFFVDSCSIEAWVEEKKIQGKAMANFTEIRVGFVIFPLNSSGSASLGNGTFEIDLPEGAEEVLLFCGNSEVRLKLRPSISDFRSFEFEGKIFNLTLSKGRFEELGFDGENASLVISGIEAGEEVEVSIEMPFEIPEGLHVYYWKEIKGSIIPVNYSISEDRRKIVFRLQDGLIDEDGEANGVIVDPLRLYIPKFRVEKEVKENEGKLKVKGERDFEITVNSSGKLRYLAFVDPENLPSRPAEFPFGLLKFSIEVERGGEAEVRIQYPSLEGLIDDEGKASFFKFNPKTLEWDSFEAEADGNAVVLRLKDGGFGDEDGEENGIISDDVGIIPQAPPPPPTPLEIEGTVLHDLFPLGRNEGEDVPIRGVEVLIVRDRNRNNIPDRIDSILRRNFTNNDGTFYFIFDSNPCRILRCFVVVNSKSIDASNASLSYNSGYSIDHIWAEQSYQTNESSYSQLIPFFGGRSELSDNVSYSGNTFTGRAEHYITINSSSYNSETLYFGFNFSLVTNTRDADDDSAYRFCQGCFRQFIANSNAIAGKQRSFFVMSVPPNVSDSNGSWWFIPLDSSLGSINATDSVEVNGTVLKADLSINDSNPGFINYDYETKSLISVETQTEIPVGVGIDGIPFSGDEAMLKAIPKPEIEIYGGNLNPALNFTSTAINSEFRNVSIFGSESYSYPGTLQSFAENLMIENVFVGLRANGTDPNQSSLSRSAVGLYLHGNNTTVRNSVVAYTERYGLYLWTLNARAGWIENVIAYCNAVLNPNGGDNIGVVFQASNVTIERCVSAKAAALGIETWYATEGIRIFNCSIEANALGNESGVTVQAHGIGIHANNSIVAYNLIRDNYGQGVSVISYTKTVFNITITRNSIYNNSKLGIDLVNAPDASTARLGDNVTLNDGVIDCSQANCGVDYPVITLAELDGDELYVEGFIGNESTGGSPAFASASVEIYLVRNSTSGDSLAGNNWSSSSQLDNHYGEGWIYLGTLYANESGYFNGSIGVAGKGVDNASLITAMTILNGNSSEFGPNARISKRLNISAEITLLGMNATIKLKAFEKARNVKVYWIKPEGLNVAFSGDYDDCGSDGNFYWWKFGSMHKGEEKFVNLSLSGTNFMLSDALNIAIDP